MTDLSQADPHLAKVNEMNREMKTTTLWITLPTEQFTRLLSLCMMLELPMENIISVGVDRIHDDVQRRMAESVIARAPSEPGLLGKAPPAPEEEPAVEPPVAADAPEDPQDEAPLPEPTQIKVQRPKRSGRKAKADA